MTAKDILKSIRDIEEEYHFQRQDALNERMNDHQRLGKEARQAREKAGIRSIDFAKAAGISQAHLLAVEGGRSYWTAHTAKLWEKGFTATPQPKRKNQFQ